MNISIKIHHALPMIILAASGLALTMGAVSADNVDDLDDSVDSYCERIGPAPTTRPRGVTVYHYYYTDEGDTKLCTISTDASSINTDRSNDEESVIIESTRSTKSDTSSSNTRAPDGGTTDASSINKDETKSPLEDTDRSNDEESVIIESTRSTKSDTSSSNTRAPDGGTTETLPIRTITEGQSTAFTVPTPRNRQTVVCVGEKNAGFVSDRTSDVAIWCGDWDHTTEFGTCLGPYTLETNTRDSRVEHAGGQRIKVTTTPSGQDTDDAGTVQIDYILHGMRTDTTIRWGDRGTSSQASCGLLETTQVEVRRGTRPGMTAAVAIHAPPVEYLNTPSTVTWECTTEVITAGIQCDTGTVITTTTQPTFPTPSGCAVVVTVATNGRGFGSTACLPQTELQSHGTMIGVDIDTLPPCPLSTHTDDMNAIPEDSSERKRCVAKN